MAVRTSSLLLTCKHRIVQELVAVLSMHVGTLGLAPDNRDNMLNAHVCGAVSGVVRACSKVVALIASLT